jgi:hypothetical protein
VIVKTWQETSKTLTIGVVGCVLAGALAGFQLGPTTTGRAVDQINGMSSRPLPSVAPNPVNRPDSVWVPDRHVILPGEPDRVRVPAHWEHRLPDGHFYVPPVTVERPSDNTFQTLPGSVREAP